MTFHNVIMLYLLGQFGTNIKIIIITIYFELPKTKFLYKI